MRRERAGCHLAPGLSPERPHTLPLQTSAEYRAEHIATFYGINPQSHDVETVTLSRGMVLTRFRGDKHPTSYKIRQGRAPGGQIARVFGLIDIIRIELTAHAQEPEHPELTRLRAVAAERKAFHA